MFSIRNESQFDQGIEGIDRYFQFHYFGKNNGNVEKIIDNSPWLLAPSQSLNTNTTTIGSSRNDLAGNIFHYRHKSSAE